MISTAANFLPFPPFLLPHTPFPRNTPLPLPPHKPHGLSIAASRRRRTESLISGASSADAELEDDEDDYEEEEEEEGELIPLQEMGRWLRNKPAGFGEGKDYDTAMEEKLLEEIERDRIAQAGSVAPDKKEQQKLKKDTLGVPTGTRVRVSNLPRKKNVHRNLQLAFKGFNGITSISPAVMGNRKTRDPICKGFAFVDLQSKEVADRFVLQYSKQSVLFGKVQKVITCSVVSTEAEDEIPENRRIGNHSRISVIPDDQAEEETVSNLNSTDGQTGMTIEHVNIIPRSAAENLNDQSEEETVSNLNSTDGQTEATIEHVNIIPRSAAENLSDQAEEETLSNLNSTDGQTEMTIEHVNIIPQSAAENLSDQAEEETVSNLNSTGGQIEATIEHVNIIPRSAAENLSEANADVPSSSDSSPSSQKKGKQVASKKKKVKSNSASLPASMVRLNVKERSVLTGVFSKYGGKAVPVLSRKS